MARKYDESPTDKEVGIMPKYEVDHELVQQTAVLRTLQSLISALAHSP